ncbi:hypothetical protein FF38_09489 [Lucilia cuprina]|uniref:Uncharacterized protein n=1 Tax=Lucilia cuprina TaxID=7375 RepID=A0A0L0C0V0_LUCCU|nr:hypothetical protein FF38_09489 [Lucilia cuprina]
MALKVTFDLIIPGKGKLKLEDHLINDCDFGSRAALQFKCDTPVKLKGEAIPPKSAPAPFQKPSSTTQPASTQRSSSKPVEPKERPHKEKNENPASSQNPMPNNISGEKSENIRAEIQDPSSSIDEHSPQFDGGRAWFVVLGAFCANFTSVGFTSITGTIQEYISTHQLKSYSEIDAYGVMPVFLPGVCLWISSLFILGGCKEYYQFLTGFSILGGIATSLIMNPSFTVVNHWFKKLEEHY